MQQTKKTTTITTKENQTFTHSNFEAFSIPRKKIKRSLAIGRKMQNKTMQYKQSKIKHRGVYLVHYILFLFIKTFATERKIKQKNSKLNKQTNQNK